LMLVTRAGIWLRALSCMTDSTLSDQDGRGPTLSQGPSGPGLTRVVQVSAGGRPDRAGRGQLLRGLWCGGVVGNIRTDVLTQTHCGGGRTCVLIMGMSQVNRAAGPRREGHLPAGFRPLPAQPPQAGGRRDDPA